MTEQEKREARIRILTLSWEYPPHKIGGIAEHVYELSKALVRRGLGVHVITLGDFLYEKNEGVYLYRIAVDASKPDFITCMNEEMKIIGALVIESTNIDVIHAHDWMVANAALDLAFRYRKPLVATIHSTEFGRSQGITEDYQMRIHRVEERLVKSSNHVIVCSESMKRELQGLFGAKAEISVIPNGIDTLKFEFFLDREAIKERFCGQSNTKLILFVGRLVYQKGVNVLIGALPIILSSYPEGKRNVKLVIVGEGPMRKQLERDAAYLGISKQVVFTGYQDDYTVISLLKAADVVVVPSLYEPFGIVALEAMAAKTPVVASDVGGLSGLINAEESVKVPPDNSEILAEGIVNVLSDTEECKKRVAVMVEKGFKKALSLNWDKVSEVTIGVYATVLARASTAITARGEDINIEIGTERGEKWEYTYS
ncbi:MAG: glycosyltransferase family 4 protein [Halobacteriota archaeon]